MRSKSFLQKCSKKVIHKKRATEAAPGTRLGIRERNPLVMSPNIVVGSTHYNVIHIITS